MSFKDDLKLSIGAKGNELLKKIIFRPYLNIPNRNYQSLITKYLFLLEVEHENINKLHIYHAKGNILHLLIKELN